MRKGHKNGLFFLNIVLSCLRTIFVLQKKEKRVVQIIALNALAIYKALKENWPEVIQAVPQHQIASYLGITPVALTRLKRTGKTSKSKKIE